MYSRSSAEYPLTKQSPSVWLFCNFLLLHIGIQRIKLPLLLLRGFYSCTTIYFSCLFWFVPLLFGLIFSETFLVFDTPLMLPLLNPWSHLWSSFSNSGRSKGEDAVFLSVAAPYYFRILQKWEYHQAWTQLYFFFVSPYQSQISSHPSFFLFSPIIPFLILSSPLSFSWWV